MAVLEVGTSASGREEVVEEGGGKGIAVGVVDEVLEEGATDALHRAAGDLALDDGGIDHHAAVLADDEAQDADAPVAGSISHCADVACVGEHERGLGS